MKKVFLAVCFCLIFSSCKKVLNLSDENYLVFGHFYGECAGEGCIEIFRLEDNRLLKDFKGEYPSGGYYKGKYKKLSTDKFDLVKDLPTYVPSDLFSEPSIIGQPDAGDWGGLYIEYNYDGVRKFWLLDQMKSNVPSKYHSFIDKVNEKIALLK